MYRFLDTGVGVEASDKKDEMSLPQTRSFFTRMKKDSEQSCFASQHLQGQHLYLCYSEMPCGHFVLFIKKKHRDHRRCRHRPYPLPFSLKTATGPDTIESRCLARQRTSWLPSHSCVARKFLQVRPISYGSPESVRTTLWSTERQLMSV